MIVLEGILFDRLYNVFKLFLLKIKNLFANVPELHKRLSVKWILGWIFFHELDHEKISITPFTKNGRIMLSVHVKSFQISYFDQYLS